MITLKVFLTLLFVVCGVLAVAALNADMKVLGGGLLIIAGIALLLLAALSVTLGLVAILVAAFLCSFTHAATT